MTQRLGVVLVAALAVLFGTVTAGPAMAALPTGTLTSPTMGSTWGPGQTIPLTTTASDTTGPTGPTAGVRTVEWWLYADGSLGAPTDFSTQYPNNGEDKIFLGSDTVPDTGTAANGTWSSSWTVPTNGAVDVTRDGDHTTPVPNGQTRHYILPSGTYRIQSHLIDDEWLAAPGEPGKTQMNTITLNTGSATTTSPPVTTSAPATTSAPVTSPPSGGSTNLVNNADMEQGSGNVFSCYNLSGWGNNTVALASVTGRTGRGAQVTVSNYVDGDRKVLQTESTVCAPKVSPGVAYDVGIWYKSTRAANLTVFRHSSAGWTYWTDLKTAPIAAGFTQITDKTPVIPAGTDQIVFGLTLGGNGTIVTDDYSLTGPGGGTTTSAPATSTPPPGTVGTELITNGNLATGSTFPTCFMSAGWGNHSFTEGFSTDVPTGATGRSWSYTISNYVSGDHKLIQSEPVGCAPSISPTRTYNLQVFYKSSSASNSLTLFRHDASGWNYWTEVRGLPTAAAWTQANATVPPIPAGTDRIAFGVSLYGNGTLKTTGYSLKDSAGGGGGTGTATATSATSTMTVTTTTTSTPPPSGGTGSWQVSTVSMPVRAMHSTLLRDGRVLLVAGSGNDEAQFNAGTFRAAVWDPSANTFKNLTVPYDMFCSGHVTLPDGRVLIAGGTKGFPTSTTYFKGSKKSYIFDPATDTFTATNDMAEEHWYPTLTKLGNGDVWAAGGLNAIGEGNVGTEMFKTASSQWLALSQVPQTYSFWGTYPHMYLMNDGRMFYAGAHTFGAGLPGTGASIYDWRTASITDVPGLRDKDVRDQAGSVLLPPAQDQKVMIVAGGNTAGTGATNHVDIIDLKAGSPAYVPGPDLPGPGKGYVNTVNLPDRTVLAANGASGNRMGNVNTAAIYLPGTNTWKSIDPDPIGRNYHSSAQVLPDGRVAIFGSNPADNSYELRVSIYSPPYLSAGPRPTVSGVPSTMTYGQSASVTVTDTVASASLLAPMSSTHQTDTNARLVDLPISGSGGTRTITIPTNSNLLPPGPYMMTVLDANGVPSTAKWVTVR